ncbi:MAG TPA: helix-turn-helix domain-containing protein [Pyrinomonadaceae bacterium]
MEPPTGANVQAELADLLSKSVVDTKTLMLRRQVSAFLDELSAQDDLRSLDLDRGISLKDEVRRFEINLIELALKRSGGNQLKAARMLDLKRSTLWAKLKSFGLLAEETRS